MLVLNHWFKLTKRFLENRSLSNAVCKVLRNCFVISFSVICSSLIFLKKSTHLALFTFGDANMSLKNILLSEIFFWKK